MADLKKEFQYYLDNQDELVKQYNGKFIVIKKDEVIGAYDSVGEAFDKTRVDHKIGTFLIQLCTPGTESYTQNFHSRAVFS